MTIDSVQSVALSINNRFIVSGSIDCSIKVFDLYAKQQLLHFEKAHSGITFRNALLSLFRFG